MVYGLFCALPGVHDLLVTVARAMRKHCHELGTSQGVPEPHSFAVRVGIVRLMMPPRPPHPASRLVTIAIRPSASEAGCTTHTPIDDSEKQKYFRERGLTGIRASRLSGKSRSLQEPCFGSPRAGPLAAIPPVARRPPGEGLSKV